MLNTCAYLPILSTRSPSEQLPILISHHYTSTYAIWDLSLYEYLIFTVVVFTRHATSPSPNTHIHPALTHNHVFSDSKQWSSYTWRHVFFQ